jgi:hypothetical protein
MSMELTTAAEVRAASRAAIERRKLLRNPKHVEIVQHDKPQEVPVGRKPKPYLIKQKYPRLDDIMAVICGYYGIDPIEFVSSRRWASAAWPRKVYYLLSKEMTPKSFPEIGNFCGGRDHTSVMIGARKLKTKLESGTDTRLHDDVEIIKLHIEDLMTARNAVTPQPHQPQELAIAWIGA